MKTKALVLTAAFSLLLGLEAHAQSPHRKFEVGGQFVGLNAHSAGFPESLGLVNDIDDLVLGGGLRGGYRITENSAVEAEVNIFQRPPTDDPATLGKWSQGLFGLKVGRKLGSNIGVFGKVRPGFARFDGITSAEILPDGSVTVRLIKDNTFFAFDIGGGVELYPSPRTIVRLDAGDVIIRYTGRPGDGFDPISNLVQRTHYGHNFQFSVGFAVRF